MDEVEKFVSPMDGKQGLEAVDVVVLVLYFVLVLAVGLGKAFTIQACDVSKENIHEFIDDMEEAIVAVSKGEEGAGDRLGGIAKVFLPLVLCIVSEVTTLRGKVKDFILENRGLQKKVRQLKKEIEERSKDEHPANQATGPGKTATSTVQPSLDGNNKDVTTDDVQKQAPDGSSENLQKKMKELQCVNHSWEKYSKKLSTKHEIEMKKQVAQLAASDERRKELERRMDEKFKEYDQTLLHARHSEAQHRRYSQAAAEQYKKDCDVLRKKNDEMTTQLRDWIKEREDKDKEIQQLNQVVKRQAAQKPRIKTSVDEELGCAGHAKPAKKVPIEMMNGAGLIFYVSLGKEVKKTRKEKQPSESTSRPRSPPRSSQRSLQEEGSPMTLGKEELKDQVELYRQQDNRLPVISDPGPILSTTSTKRDKSATGDQGHVEGKPPAGNEDNNLMTSWDSNISNLGSVRPLDLTRQCEPPKEEGKVDVTDKNDGGQRVYSKLDPELSCNSHGKQQAKGDPILQRPNNMNKRKTLILTGYSGVHIFRSPLFVITLMCTPSVMSVLGNVNLVWYKEGDNVTIYFPFESYDAESTQMIVNVRMRSVPKPFYSNGIIEQDGFKDDSQIKRFNVSEDGEGLKIDITAAQWEDEDLFIFTQISLQDNGGANGVSRLIQLKLLTPAQCYVVSDSLHIVVHCIDAVASHETALFCFQGTITYRPDNILGTDGNVEIWIENNGEQIVCCTAARNGRGSISATPENCRDFTWSPTTPTRSHGQNGIGTSRVTSTTGIVPKHNGGNSSCEHDETVPLMPSSGSRLRYLRILITGTGLVLSWLFFI